MTFPVRGDVGRPTLTVHGSPTDWLPKMMPCGLGCKEVHGCSSICEWPDVPRYSWVAVETLPCVWFDRWRIGSTVVCGSRPLRVGDTVTLAWRNDDSPHPTHDAVPFASATVAGVRRIWHDAPEGYDPNMVAIDGEFEFSPQQIDPDLLPNAQPGGWAVRVEQVSPITERNAT